MARHNSNTIRIITLTIALITMSSCSAPAGVWIAGGPAGAIGYELGTYLASDNEFEKAQEKRLRELQAICGSSATLTHGCP